MPSSRASSPRSRKNLSMISAMRHAKTPSRISSRGWKCSTIGNVVTPHLATVHRLSSKRDVMLLKPVSMKSGEDQLYVEPSEDDMGYGTRRLTFVLCLRAKCTGHSVALARLTKFNWSRKFTL